MLLILTVSAQQGINYKALIKDGSGNVVASQSITIQFQILQGAGMTNVYQETHSPITDANGIIIVNIGEGGTSDDFTTIDWGVDDHFLNVQINTGSGLTDLGTTQFMAVPYALSSGSSIDQLTDGKSDNDGTENGSSLFLGIDAGLNDDSTDNGNVGVGFNALYDNTSGNYNTANGYKALFSNTSGPYNSAYGDAALYSNITGGFNTAIGATALFNITSANSNTAIGYATLSNTTTGGMNIANGFNALYSNIIGNSNVAIGYESGYNSIGSNNVFLGYKSGYNETTANKLYIENSSANANNALIYGEFGTDATTTGNILRTNSEFQIGNPTSTGYAFPTTDGTVNQVLLTNGNGVLSWTSPNLSSGLEALDEGNGIGWRLVGQNPNNYGDIGLNAVDFSYSGLPSTAGATGSRSTAMGDRITASGTQSTAMGYNTTASGSTSTTMGHSTTASGDSSTAMGGTTTASGYYSTAMGGVTTASGTGSTAMGYRTTASSLNSTAIGYYNIGGGNPTVEEATDPLFEIGNGTSSIPANALTVLKNGKVGIGSANPTARLHITSNSGEDAFRVQIDGSTKFFIHANGGIANSFTTPTFALNLQNSTTDLLGRGRAYSWNTYSDRRIKSSIRNINYGLQTIMKLRPTAYNHHNTLIDEKSGASRLSSESVPDIGLIAQEVYKLVPESVSKPANDEDLWSMDYTRLVPVLIKAIQEQQIQIEALKNGLKQKDQHNTTLEARLEKIEQVLSSMNN